MIYYEDERRVACTLIYNGAKGRIYQGIDRESLILKENMEMGSREGATDIART